MPIKMAKNHERAAEDAYRLAALRRRALADTQAVLVRADDAADQAGQLQEDAGAEGAATPEAGTL